MDFNKDIARIAAARFPFTVQCQTAHATAFVALGHRYTSRLNGPHQPAWKTGQSLGLAGGTGSGRPLLEAGTEWHLPRVRHR